jgi:hypothetical protein
MLTLLFSLRDCFRARPMPVHAVLGVTRTSGFLPDRSQRNAEELVQGGPSTARSLRVQRQQLLTKGQVFEDEVLAGVESADHPPEEMSERQDHGKNIIGKVRINPCAKSFICGCTTFWRGGARVQRLDGSVVRYAAISQGGSSA